MPFRGFFNGATDRVRRSSGGRRAGLIIAYLDESNIGSLLTEALTADVQTILADETGLVCADTAVGDRQSRLL